MRRIWILIAIALALPSYASEKCDLFEDVVKRVCIKSFSNALGRDLGSFENKRQEEQNNYVYVTCNGAATITKNNCDAGKFDSRGVDSCAHVANVANDSVQTACRINDTPAQAKNLDQIFTVLGKNQRAAICKNAVVEVRGVARGWCKQK